MGLKPFISKTGGDGNVGCNSRTLAHRVTSMIFRGGIFRHGDQWPELQLDRPRVSISRISQRRGRIDRPHRREGDGRPHRADRQWAPAHLQGTGGLVEPAGACAGGELRRQARQPRPDPLRQQSGAGRGLAGGDQGRRRRRQHHADAARRRTDKNRRQGGDRAGADRQPHRRRTGRLRQDQPVSQAGREFRRHLEPRRRARPGGAEQAGAVRCGQDRPRRCRAVWDLPRAPRASRRRRCISIAIF